MSVDPKVGSRPAAAGADQAVRAALSSGPRPARPSAISSTLSFGWRGMLKIKHVPEQLVDVTITPVLFTVMFTYIYGGAISGSTGEYLQYIMPGTIVMSVVFTTVYSGVALNTDMTKGVVDRFRTLPMWQASPLAGAMIGDGLRYLAAGIVVIVVGLILGYSPPGGADGLILALLLVIVFSLGLAWVFTTVGLLMRSPTAVMNTGFMALFPLLFLSNAFVPPETLPDGLRDFVDVNPVTQLIDAMRGLMDGTSQAADIYLVLGIAAGLTAVFAPLTIHLYRTKT